MSKIRASAAMVALGIRVAAQEKFVLIFSMGYYALFIFIFANIWKHTPFVSKAGQDINFSTMVWYIAVTELVTFSAIQFREQVRADIAAGQLTGLMGRPLPYWLLMMLQLLGRGLLHFAFLAGFGFAVAYATTGQYPFPEAQAGFVLAGVVLALLLSLVSCFVIGMLDVWGPYSRPAYWIWQKCLFVMGGLIMPLSLYPQWLQDVAAFTPFPAMVYLSALPVLRHGAADFASILLQQIVWLAGFMAAALWVHRAAKNHIGRAGD